MGEKSKKWEKSPWKTAPFSFILKAVSVWPGRPPGVWFSRLLWKEWHNIMNAAYEIERLLQFGQKHKLIKGLDVLVARNQLLDLFHLDAPYEGEVPQEEFQYPTELLENLLDLAARQGLFDNEVNNYRVNFEARIMGCMMPGAQQVAKRFKKLYEKKGPKAATNYFYKLCIDSNYIRTAQIAKNIKWVTPTQYGDLEITINLTKPEKDPKTIALERLQPKSGYPACMLCKENIGYAGRINFPARQTHRIVPITLAGEQFYLQYSPYAYFHEHCIMLHEQHKPMEMNKQTLAEMLIEKGVFTEKELRARADVSYELYAKTINIEALTMIDMAGKDIVPAVVRYTGELARAAREVESLGVDASVQKELLTRVNVLLRQAGDALADLRVKQEKAAALTGAEQARYAHDVICPAMEVLRAPVDHLEMIVDGKLWPMPTYGDLLFNV